MMCLKQYQKLIKLIKYTLLFFSICLNSQTIKKDNIKIVEIALKINNKTTFERVLTYLVINNEVYTGIILNGGVVNYDKNIIDSPFESMIYNSLWAKWEENKCRNNTVFHPLTEINVDNISFFLEMFCNINRICNIANGN